MAGLAEKRGLPAELPLMASLVESGMKNLNFGDADSVGFFQMRVGIWNQGEYAGYPDKPELQMKWFLDTAEQVKKARVAAGKPIDDPNSFGEWIADVERPAEQYRGRYQTQARRGQGPARQPAGRSARGRGAGGRTGGRRRRGRRRGGRRAAAEARSAPRRCRSPRASAACARSARTRGPQVNEYLAAAKVAPGNPWCASFITWSLEKAGHKMPGGGWAAVQTWVRNAEQGNNGLKIVSAEEARPGDIVAYDWGGQEDFGADGHIGFLDSTVKGGKFTALEGNNADTVDPSRAVDGRREHQVHPHRGQRLAAGAAQADAPAPGAPVAPPVDAAAPSKPIDPAQFGGEGAGTGGPPSAESLALLKNKNVVLDDVGIKDIKAGRIDPRVVAVLTKLSSEHKITVSCMCSDHSKFTAGGSVSNHYFGRGMDIAAIDGEIVGPGSPLAREVASELSTLDENYRPNEIGSPFAIDGAGYFTDAAHQNHLHIGFKQAITPDWKPPADVAAAAARRARAPWPPPPRWRPAGAPAAAAAAPEPRKGSQGFLRAVTAEAAEADRKARGASQGFLKAVEPPKASAAAAQPRPAAAPRARRARGRRGRRRRRGGRRRRAAPDAYPGDDAPQEQIAAWMAGMAKKRGLPPQLPMMAVARRVRHEEPQLRRRRLGRVLPDARRDLEPGRLRRLPGQAGAADQVVPRPGRGGQAPAAGRGQVGRRPEQLRRVDRRRRAPRRAVPRPLPAQARRRPTACCSPPRRRSPPRRAAPPPLRRCRPPTPPRPRRASRRSATRSCRPRSPGRCRRRSRPANAPGPKALAAIQEASKYLGHRLQVGRLDAADRLRLLRPDAVVLRAVRACRSRA